MFITFEGADGCGKSTQSRRLYQTLIALGQKAILTREPGGSPGAEEIRALILGGSTDRWSAETELLLFNAARRDHLEKTVWPAVGRGEIVICDRFADSTRAYQGVARADLTDKVEALHRLMIGCEPDLTFILDMDPGASLARGTARLAAAAGPDESRFERMGIEFQARIARAFRQIASDHPDRCHLIEADGPIDEIADRVWRVLRARLPALAPRVAGALPAETVAPGCEP